MRSALAPYQLHRLRLLAEKPRSYTTRDNINPALQRLGLVSDTGRHDPVRRRRVWAITAAGLVHLQGRADA